MIKILFVGSSKYPMYVNAFYNASKQMEGIQSVLFDTELEARRGLLYRIEQNLAVGYSVSKLNSRLKKTIKNNDFDIVFLYSVRTVTGATIRYIKQRGIYVATYSNDNPFSDSFRKDFWRHFREQVKYADLTYVYRISNFEQAKKGGAKKIKLLMSYYINSRNYLIDEDKCIVDCPRVLFLGHREEDERLIYLKKLLEAGVQIGVPDYEWIGFEKENPYLIRMNNTQKNYNEYLNSCDIAIVFLSSINRDTYTRRCFEIPAVQKMMIAPATEDILAMFEEDKEIVVFRNEEEFVEKIMYYLSHDEERKQIAKAGYERLMRDGHEATDRVKLIISDYLEYKAQQNGNYR